MGWMDPLVGGIDLRKPAIRSPNFVSGSAGWTINVDGSAEFNNLTIRGTFFGTDYILNSSGAFFYSGVPAAGNLIASIASAAGTDSFGNAYPSGVNSQTSTFFTNLAQGSVFLGNIVAGSQDLTHAAELVSEGASGGLLLTSGDSVAAPDKATFVLVPGATGQKTGSATAPFATFADLNLGSSAMDVRVTGSVVAADPATGNPRTWQSTSAAAGWALGDFAGVFQPFQYRLDNQDDIVGVGAIHATGALAAGTYQFLNVAVPAAYIPAKNQRVVCVQTTSGDAFKATAYLQLTTAGLWKVMTSTAIAANDNFYLGATFPLGNIP